MNKVRVRSDTEQGKVPGRMGLESEAFCMPHECYQSIIVTKGALFTIIEVDRNLLQITTLHIHYCLGIVWIWLFQIKNKSQPLILAARV